MNNPFDYVPDSACEDAFQKLLDNIENIRKSDCPEDINFCRELENGKMLGVLLAEDKDGNPHTLYAFSGQLGCGGFHHPGFVGPVFDYLQPDGYFKIKEREISLQNKEIAAFEKEKLEKIRDEYYNAEAKANRVVDDYKEKCRLSKLERNSKREAGNVDDIELAAMIRQSQFEKAELRRIKNRVHAQLQPYADQLKKAQSHLDFLKAKRRSDSEALQEWLFSNFRIMNAQGESKSLKDIFADTPLRIPPSGAGECCAPKLLQAAYQQGLKPLEIAEYWYGKSIGGEIRRHGEHYPACRGKCLPVLTWMLQGLDIDPPLNRESGLTEVHDPEIIYENQWFCVVNKPSGMLSVPGKGAAISVQQWLMKRYGPGKFVRMVHRLDQDTSGLLIAAFSEETFKIMQSLFATRKVKKRYIAELEGDYLRLGLPRCGQIELPLSPDWLDRPRQRVDYEGGKDSVTYYEFTTVSGGTSRIEFQPLTGRTHQLRVHAASEKGLGMPIVGDRLYGKKGGNGAGRLMLHAQRIEFTFPIDSGRYSFEIPVPF